MNLRVAVLAGAAPDLSNTGCSIDRVPEGLAHAAAAETVAACAKIRTRLLEQLVVVGTVRQMAVEAILAHRGMLPDERATFLGMTGVAQVIDGLSLEQTRIPGAVGIMAILAGHLAFRHRHMRLLPKFRALLLVTALAGLGNASLLQQATGRELGHRVVAVAASELLGLVDGAGPIHAIAALVTSQTHFVLLGLRSSPRLGETDQVAVIGRIGRMLRTGTMTGLADLLFSQILRILAKDLGMQRMAEILVLGFMATGANLLSDIAGGVGCRCGLGCTPCRKKQQQRGYRPRYRTFAHESLPDHFVPFGVY